MTTAETQSSEPITALSPEPHLAPDAPRLGVPSGTAPEPPPAFGHRRAPWSAQAGVPPTSTAGTRRTSFSPSSRFCLSPATSARSSGPRSGSTGSPGPSRCGRTTSPSCSPRTRAAHGAFSQGATSRCVGPFFLLVSVAAIAFIVTLYRKLTSVSARSSGAFRWCSAVLSATSSTACATVTSSTSWMRTSSGRARTTTGRRSTSPTSPSASALASWPSTC